MPAERKPRHPGAVLNEQFLKPLDLSEHRLAIELRVPVTRISAIVRGKRGVTVDTALRLARYFKNEPLFWLAAQLQYDLEVSRQKSGQQIERDIRPRDEDD